MSDPQPTLYPGSQPGGWSAVCFLAAMTTWSRSGLLRRCGCSCADCQLIGSPSVHVVISLSYSTGTCAWHYSLKSVCDRIGGMRQ
jgi:hypothetical protein